MPAHRDRLRSIFSAALAAVAPDAALLQHVQPEGPGGDVLTVGGQRWSLQGKGLFVLGAGKAAAPMAQAVEQLLGDRITDGLVLVKHGHGLPLKHIQLAEGGHPVPDAAGVAAAQSMLHMAAQCGPEDVILALFTGGASALTSVPAAGLSLNDVQQTTALLLACGAEISEINALRKHLTVFGGGQFARAARGARILCLVVSDVVGDPLDVIASGPTVPDASTFARCQQILNTYGLEEKLPAPVRQRLAAGLAGTVPETPKADAPCFQQVQTRIIASNRQALEAAAREARQLGYSPCILTHTMTGEAAERARELVAVAKARAATLDSGSRGLCLLAGGETTVTIRGSGTGGRNQEMALAAALELEDCPHIHALFAGTDGTDGPTDAAGGFASATTVQAMGGRAVAQAMLAANDSYHALEQGGALLRTGPTRTNVMDVGVLLVDNPSYEV